MTAGERYPRALAALGQGKMSNGRLPALAAALTGMRSGPEHAHAATSLLSAIDLLEEEIRVAEDAVTAHLAAIPAARGVDADGQRLVQNTPTGDIQAPLLIAQGLADPLVLPAVQARYVRQRCAAGQKLDYLTYPGRDHVGLVDAGSPLIPTLISWTKNRLAGKPAPDNCATS